MASGSSGRPGSAPKGFDFASNDILCSYEDYTNQDSSNSSHSDPSNPNNDFQKSRISRSSVFPTANVYSQPEDSLNSEVVTTVERSMKKYSDNLMRFLEGISSRLSQLELYCYNLDKSIGEMRSDLVRDHGDADSKLKSLEKHLQEVHRSVQILRDKQELAETHKELAKLQLAQKESSGGSHDERSSVSGGAESKKTDDVSDTPNTQLALALPSQVTPQSSHAPPPAPSQNITQVPPYYMPSNQLPNPQPPSQPSYLPPDAQYRASPPTHSGPQQQAQTQVNQPHQAQQFPQYQQQWQQQVSQPPQQPQPPPMRPPSPQSSVYPPYMGGQPSNPPPPETMASSMPMQVPFPGMPPQGMSHAESMPYGYGGTNRPGQPQPQPPSHMKPGFPSQPGDGYPPGGSHPPMSSGGSFMLYDNEGARTHHAPPPRYTQGGYPPPNQSLSTPPPRGGPGPGPQQFGRNHPYNELIEKLVNMGYRGDHAASVIQRLEESGQQVDFNAVLDRLNGHSSGGSQRGW